MGVTQEPEQSQRPADRRGRRVARWLLLAILALLLTAGGWLGYRYWEELRVLGDESINIMIIGMDIPLEVVTQGELLGDEYPATFSYFGCKADALVVATIHPISKSVRFLALPGEVVVNLPNGDRGQLKDVFAAGGIRGVQGALEELLDVPVHHYALVDYVGFTRLVDAVGGVELSVDHPIRYYDDGQLEYELEQGTHWLCGEEALRYVRYRGDLSSEMARLGRHQKFLTALAERLLEKATIRQLPSWAKSIDELVETDLSWEKGLKLGAILLRQKPLTFEVVLLPVKKDDIGFLPDHQAIQKMKADLFYNPSWSRAED